MRAAYLEKRNLEKRQFRFYRTGLTHENMLHGG